MKISIPGDTTDTEVVDVNPISWAIIWLMKRWYGVA